MKNGFIKVAAAAPVIKVCDCDYNADKVIECIEKAEKLGVKVLAFPALTLTGVECRDLFHHRVLLDGAEKALAKVVAATKGKDMLVLSCSSARPSVSARRSPVPPPRFPTGNFWR